MRYKMKHGQKNQSRKRPYPKGIHWLVVGVLLGIYINQYRHNIINLHHQTTSSSTIRLLEPFNDRTHVGRFSVLPKRLITIFGAESSGSTFLATTLGIATGVFPKDGKQVTLPSDRYNNTGRTIVQRTISKRARSANGDIEIQHLSLPWGWWGSPKRNCDLTHQTITVEALVPEPCFRFDYESTWEHRLEVKAPAGCRKEAHISGNSNANSGWTCGTNNCGQGANEGYALYPRRFFVNITSHLEWYLKRGVDVTCILSVRDQSVSRAGKIKTHCSNKAAVFLEEHTARTLMSDALNRYGRKGRSNDGVRVLTVSYEALMTLRESYLFDTYKMLGVNSTYIPEFKDGNAKYIKDN